MRNFWLGVVCGAVAILILPHLVAILFMLVLAIVAVFVVARAWQELPAVKRRRRS